MGLGPARLREIAARHGVRPTKALGQHFLADPNLARRIVSLAGVQPGDRVLEVGAGLGSLTVPLAEAGATVTAVELDRGLVPALREVLAPHPGVTVVHGDAMETDWAQLLDAGDWKMVSNLPYNVAVPLLLELLGSGLPITDYLVMVQREVGERLAARAGEPGFGAVSLRVSYFADARVLRRVPPTVFWPAPQVESVLVRLTPREPPVATPRARLFHLIEAGFAQRRKTMRNALVRLGLSADESRHALEGAGLSADVRAEELGLEQFASLAEQIR